MDILELSGHCDHEIFAASLGRIDWTAGYDNRLAILLKDKPFLDASCMASLVSWGKGYLASGGSIEFVGNDDPMSYLARMNVFNQLDFDYTELFNRQNEKGRFLPVMLVQDEDSVAMATEAICELVLQRFDNARDFLPAMEWCVCEVVDNVRVHSETATPGVVCAQFYPKRKRLDIAIVDQGRGIKTSLEERLELHDHRQAISRALERGVTRNPDIGQGNGLAGTLEIVRKNHGTLHVWTGDAEFLINRGEGDDFRPVTEMAGTGVFVSLDTRRPVDLSETFIGDSGWSYIDYVAVKIEEGGGLKIRDECRHTGGRETARPLRRKIESLLPDMEGVLQLDFSGVRSATSSYLDELLGRLAVKLGKDTFRERVQLINATREIVNIANVVINQRLSLENGSTFPQ